MGVAQPAFRLRNCLQWPHKRDFLDKSDSEVTIMSCHPADAELQEISLQSIESCPVQIGSRHLCLEIYLFTFVFNENESYSIG